jgi:hypothetical protein
MQQHEMIRLEYLHLNKVAIQICKDSTSWITPLSDWIGVVAWH